MKKPKKKKIPRSPYAQLSRGRNSSGPLKNKKDKRLTNKNPVKNYHKDYNNQPFGEIDESWNEIEFVWDIDGDDGWVKIEDGNDILKEMVKKKDKK